MSKPTRIGLLILVIVVLLSIDQMTKLWAYSALVPRQSIPLFGPIDLTLVFNRSTSFGLAPDFGEVTRWGLTAVNIAVAYLIGYWVWSRDHSSLLGVGLSFIVAGSLGNAIDRIWLGTVIDMLDASETGFRWVFNLSDVFIDVGVALWLLAAALGHDVIKSAQEVPSPAPTSV